MSILKTEHLSDFFPRGETQHFSEKNGALINGAF